MAATTGQALHTLVAGFVRRTWLVGLVAFVICVAFAASATSSLLEASYLPPPATGGALSVGPVQAAVVAKPKLDGSAFVARNMFCSTCAPARPDVAGSTGSFTPNAVLIALSHGDTPSATIRVPVSEVQGSYGEGDTILGIGKVTRIGWRSIDVVDDAGRTGRLNLLDQQLASVAPPPAATGVAAADPFAGRIRKIDAHTFEVDRDLVKDLVSGAAKPGQMQMMPLPNPNGSGIAGLRLRGVRGSSIGAQLGLQNGDTLQAINNQKIENLNQLLDIYSRIDTITNVELAGTRGDKPLELTLRLK